MNTAQLTDNKTLLETLKGLQQSFEGYKITTNLEIKNRDETIAYLEEQLAWFKRQIFGQRSERITSGNDQQLLFPGFEELEVVPKKEK